MAPWKNAWKPISDHEAWGSAELIQPIDLDGDGRDELLSLEVVRDDQSVAVQTPEALAGLRLAYVLVPITGTLIAIAIMWQYDLTEERSHEIRQQIADRKGV